MTDWVTVKKLAEMTGFSTGAIYARIHRDDWAEGIMWRKRGGRVLISVKAYEAWVEAAPVS